MVSNGPSSEYVAKAAFNSLVFDDNVTIGQIGQHIGGEGGLNEELAIPDERVPIAVRVPLELTVLIAQLPNSTHKIRI